MKGNEWEEGERIQDSDSDDGDLFALKKGVGDETPTPRAREYPFDSHSHGSAVQILRLRRCDPPSESRVSADRPVNHRLSLFLPTV